MAPVSRSPTLRSASIQTRRAAEEHMEEGGRVNRVRATRKEFFLAMLSSLSANMHRVTAAVLAVLLLLFVVANRSSSTGARELSLVGVRDCTAGAELDAELDVCTFPLRCGGGGVEGSCGCSPLGCKDFGRTCGYAPNGCGGVTKCGGNCRKRSAGAAPAPAWPFRVGEMAHWGQFNEGPRRFSPDNIQGKLFTHLIYNYVALDESFNVVARFANERDLSKEKGMWSSFAATCRAQGVVPLVGVGGAAWPEGVNGADFMKRLVEDRSRHEEFARKLVAWVRAHGFLGVMLDGDLAPRGRGADWVELVRAMRRALKEVETETEERQWLVLDVPWWASDAGSDAPFPDKAALVEELDFVTLRAFYMRDKSSGTSQAHSALFAAPGRQSGDTLVKQWIEGGAPAAKLVLGIPCFAELTELRDGSSPGFGQPLKQTDSSEVFMAFADLPSELQRDGGRVGLVDGGTGTAYGFSGRTLAAYDSPESVAAKVDYVLQMRLAGTCLVTIDQDSDMLLARAITERLKVPYSSAEKTRSSKKGPRLLVTSSYPHACENRGGDHLLARALKNKVDYARAHGWELFQNQGRIQTGPGGWFTKAHLLRSIIQARRELEWVMWVDADAIFTNFASDIRFERYDGYDLVVYGERGRVFDTMDGHKPDWTSLNAGVILLRNGEWARAFLDRWLEFDDLERLDEHDELLANALGGRGRNGEVVFKADDQGALLYLLLSEREGLGSRIYIEEDQTINFFWDVLVPRLDDFLRHAGPGYQWHTAYWPPLLTHFAGCALCRSSARTGSFDMGRCKVEIERTLNFADNQVLFPMGLVHKSLNSSELVPISTP